MVINQCIKLNSIKLIDKQEHSLFVNDQ